MFGIISVAAYVVSASPICTMVMPSCSAIDCLDTQNCMIVTPFNGCPKAECVEIVNGKPECPDKASCKLDEETNPPVICPMVMPSCAGVACSETQNCMIVTPFNECQKAECVEIVNGKPECPVKASCNLDRQVDHPAICPMVMPTCQNVACNKMQNCMIVTPFNGCPKAECVNFFEGKHECPAETTCRKP
ncbi:hypothetical protein HDV06_000776 [Boothiomyces sp. JEL0866]|nr:hypothetical protein HDV06_000776 [Boothiomyces sp. JEL0866]